jgi:hypothetical protein
VIHNKSKDNIGTEEDAMNEEFLELAKLIMTEAKREEQRRTQEKNKGDNDDSGSSSDSADEEA